MSYLADFMWNADRSEDTENTTLKKIQTKE